jgi:2-polyprenyl-3-methyl-5-hydroxy-6-metoxy-1,4-benzoquinol methylase
MIATWSTGVADEWMAEDILVDLNEIIHGHPWWKARATLAIALLRQAGVAPPSRVLDAGCGWGVTLEALEKASYQVAGLDISLRCLKQLERLGRALIQADLTQPLPAAAETYDAVLALDVIEHLDDDAGAVTRFGQLTRPGGVVLLSVPALPEMYSEFDLIQGHRRRHLPDTLRRAFAASGLTVEKVLWWGQWLVPMLRRQRDRSYRTPRDSPAETYRRYLSLPPWPLSWILSLVFRLERSRTLRGASSTGSSLFAVARKV